MKNVLIGVVILVLIVAAGAWLYLDRIAQAAVERGGTRALQVPVRVDSMALSPVSGRLGMEGFRVANPEGFSNDSLLRLDGGRVAVRLGSLLGDTVEIPEIRVQGLRVRLERNDSGTNLRRLLDNLERGGGGDGTGSSGSAGSGGKTQVRIGVLRIEGASAAVDLGPGLGERGRFELDLPPIELRDIGTGDKAATIEQVVERVLRAVVERVQAAGAERFPDEVRRELRQRFGRRAQELEQKAEEAKEKLKKKLEEQAKDLLQ